MRVTVRRSALKALLVGLVLADGSLAVGFPLYVHARLEDGKLVGEAASVEAVAFQAFADSGASPGRLSFDSRDFNPAFETKRFECRVDKIDATCLPEKSRSLPRCSPFEGNESRFVKVSSFRSGYGDTPTERGTPSAWDKTPTAGKIVAAPFIAAAAVTTAVVYAPVAALAALARPSCAGVRTRWVEFDHDSFRAAARKAWEQTRFEGQGDAISSALAEMLKKREGAEEAMRSRWATKVASYAHYSNAKPKPFKPTAQPSSLGLLPVILVGQDTTQAEKEYESALQAAAQTELAATAARLDAEWEAWRSAHVQAQRTAFERARTSTEMAKFASLYAQTDEAGLVESALARVVELERREQSAMEEMKAQQRLVEAEKVKRTANFRDTLKTGTETNCGPVVEVKKPLALVAAPVQGYGNTHWLRIADLYPPGFGCRFVNGSYVGP